MTIIVDSSQEIFDGMSLGQGLPPVELSVYVSHEEWEGIGEADTATPAVNRLGMGEHTGTHVDSISHIGRPYRVQSIDHMPLEMFYTEALCLDLSRKGLRELIDTTGLQAALSRAEL